MYSVEMSITAVVAAAILTTDGPDLRERRRHNDWTFIFSAINDKLNDLTHHARHQSDVFVFVVVTK
jgi:hypothetical protein